MKNRSSQFCRRFVTATAALAVCAGALLLPTTADAGDLPAPTVRRSSTRPARAPAPRSRTVRTTATRPYATPYVRPQAAQRPEATQRPQAAQRPETAQPTARATAGTYRFRRATADDVTPRATNPNAPSEPTVWQRGKRHSTYVPPSAPRTANPVATRPAPVARSTAVPAARAPRAASPRRVLASGRSTYTPPARTQPARTQPARTQPARTPRARYQAPAAPRQALSAPSVRKMSPSYADLRRSQPTYTASRARSTNSTAHKRRSYPRRSTATRRGRSTSVPAAPGEQVQPVPSTRRLLPLLPRPGCCADG